MNRRNQWMLIAAIALLCAALTACGSRLYEPVSSAPESIIDEVSAPVDDDKETTVAPTTTTVAATTTTTLESGETTTTTVAPATTKPTTKTPTTKTTAKTPTTKKPTTKKPTTKKPTTGVTTPQQGNGQVTAQMLSIVETEFLRLVNQERVAVGKKPLTVNTALDAGAQIRAQEITTHFSHTRPDGSDCYSAIGHEEHFWTMGENIAYTGFAEHGYISSADVFTGSEQQLKQVAANAFRQFKESPGHYANMINGDFEQTGIGVLSKPEPALGVPVFYVAHFFGTPWDF